MDNQSLTEKKIKGKSHYGFLQIQDISTYYGEAQALKDISFNVNRKEVVAILGSNGAGKTTLLRTLTGLLKPTSGKIYFNGEDITGKAPHKIIAKGIASVPEGRELFGSMSVADNLALGIYSLNKRERKEMTTSRLEMIFGLFPVLKRRLKQKSETLSGGEQQMLALGRALMANPRSLALDEPSLGLSPLLVAEMMKLLKRICDEMEISVLLVEQNARAALKIAFYAHVLERGEIVLSGSSNEVVNDARIQRAYLGG